jgi:hypothetical protein
VLFVAKWVDQVQVPQTCIGVKDMRHASEYSSNEQVCRRRSMQQNQ